MKVCYFFLIFFLPFLIIFGNFHLVLNNTAFYQEEFQKQNVYDANPNADNTVEEILLFFRGRASLSMQPEEITHMYDVRKLIRITFWMLIASLMVVLLCIFLLRKKPVQAMYATGAGAVLALVLLIVTAYAVLNFQEAFIQFHELLFPPGTWTFPPDSLLIQTFPQPFFENFLSLVLRNSAITAIILMAIPCAHYLGKKIHMGNMPKKKRD